MSIIRNRWILTLGTIALNLMLLSACGQKEEATTAPAVAEPKAAIIAGSALGTDRLSFSGGPEGGTFQYFSNGIAIRLSKNIPDVEVSNTASAGSLENLRRVNSGEADFGIVYSGDTFLGREGRLTNDTRKYENVYAMAYLYGAPAHLIVKEGSGINKVADLEGQAYCRWWRGFRCGGRCRALLHVTGPVGQDGRRVSGLFEGRLGARR